MIEKGLSRKAGTTVPFPVYACNQATDKYNFTSPFPLFSSSQPNQHLMQIDAASQQQIEKVFVNAEGQATIACTNCNTPKVFQVLHLLNRPHVLRVKCYCGHTFMVKLDFRQAYRKPTKLSGNFTMLPPSLERGVCVIIDLSLTGLCFETIGSHKLKVGQRGYVDFDLDNKKKTHIRKGVIIRKIEGKEYGCEFTDSEAFEKELGFYMRFGG